MDNGQQTMKWLIVNADDFGLTKGVNKAIIEAFERGILTSTSLMAGGAAFEEAVRLAKDHPGLGIGVHLTLVNGQPVSAPESVPSLVRPDKKFYHSPVEFIAKLELARVRMEDIGRELRAQISRTFDAGIQVTHVDGHKHLHIYPKILDVVVQVMNEFGIKWMRLPLESPNSVRRPSAPGRVAGGSGNHSKTAHRPSPSAQILPHLLVSLAAKSGKRKLKEAGIGFPDHFHGLFETGAITEPQLQIILEHLPEGTSEIMCHPGYDDEELAGTRTRLRSQREQELKALTSSAVCDLIKKNGIELINYGDIV